MQKSLIRKVVHEQRAAIPMEHYIERECHMDLDKAVESDSALIVTGIRRCGKSSFLNALRTAQTEQDYYLNFDDERLLNFEVEDFQQLMEIYMEDFGEQKTCYFDEIQNVDAWERFVRRLFDQGYKVYITGSNARMLSQELGTHLTGRHLTMNMYPFSFREFCAYRKLSVDPAVHTTAARAQISRAFKDYLRLGGFPQYLNHELPEYLQSLYENILYRDIITRYKLPSESAIRQLAHHLASNAGKLVTYNSLKKLLGLASANTVSDYCTYLENAFLFFFVRRFSHSLKSQSASPKKAYAIDIGMAGSIGFRSSGDRGRFLENVVFIELKRRYYDVYYHHEKKECDFVVCRFNKILSVIQVCYSMEDDATQSREVEGLLEAMEAYKLKTGLILTFEEHDEMHIEREGKQYHIEVMPVWEWMNRNTPCIGTAG